MVMILRCTHIILLLALALFIFNSGDYHICSDGDEHHAPMCEDCSCVNCSSGLNGIYTAIEKFDVIYNLSEFLVFSNSNFNFGEIAVELDRPPKA